MALWEYISTSTAVISLTHTTATHPRQVQQVSQCDKSTQEHKRKKEPFLIS